MSAGGRLSAPAQLLRLHDPDRYRFALFAPADKREALFTLFAFNHEVAKTRDSVSETMIGAIRLQWWREAMDGIFAGAPRQHEIVLPLASCIAELGLPRGPFDALIDARERDLEDGPMEDLATAITYLRSTTAPLVQLSTRALGGAEDTDIPGLEDIAAGHALIGKLRATAHLEAGRRPFFPRTLLQKHGANIRRFSELHADEGGRAAVAEALAEALALINRGLRATSKSRHLAPLLLPAKQARARARLLEALGNDPFQERFAGSDPFDVWRFWLARLSGRY